MTEQQLRASVVSAAMAWLDYNEADGSHRQIIDVYNTHRPLARGYAVKYTDAWCATFVSAVFIRAGLTEIAPTECGCEEMIKLYMSHPSSKWVEDESIIPEPGDVIFYDWQDDGKGDNKGFSDHVGIVVSVSGSTMKIIEGNISNSVGYRSIPVNALNIRGYGKPAYGGAGSDKPAEEQKVATNELTPQKLAELLPEAFAILATKEAAPWAKEALDWCRENGYMVGDGTGNQQPMKPLLRQEAAQIIKNIIER